jgi:hypothetical protein
MTTAQFSCEISSSDPTVPLVLKIYIDGDNVKTLDPVPNKYQFESLISDSETTENHSIEFELLGKLPEHTIVDDQGNIVKDAVVTVRNKQFESIAIDTVFDQRTQYQHDFNGSGDQITDEFFGAMGCNGRTKFEFTTPIYIWMLENL